ncbi:hypothetical protein S83_069562, partial [Arachis hypogaea]
ITPHTLSTLQRTALTHAHARNLKTLHSSPVTDNFTVATPFSIIVRSHTLPLLLGFVVALSRVS